MGCFHSKAQESNSRDVAKSPSDDEADRPMQVEASPDALELDSNENENYDDLVIREGTPAPASTTLSAVCPSCDQPVQRDKPDSLSLQNKTWHAACFKCGKCAQVIEKGSTCTMLQGVPHHGDCYNQVLADQGKVICHGCKQEIKGEYTKALNRCWHKNHFACATCGISLVQQKVYETEGNVWCERDYQDRFFSKCGTCNKPVVGEYILAFDKKFHPDHFVCVKCKRSFGDDEEFKDYLDQPYCDDCVPKFVECGQCNKELDFKPDELFLVNEYGQPYCKHHDGHLEKCIGCGADIVGKPQDVAFSTCSFCVPNIVNDNEKLDRAWQAVTTAINDSTDISHILYSNIKPRLVEKEEFIKTAPAYHAKRYSFTKSTSQRVDEILVLKGLPWGAVRATLAHEVGHCYLTLYGFSQLKPLCAEGICEFFVYQWFMTPVGRNEPAIAYYVEGMKHSEDELFGLGFQYCYDAVRLADFHTVLKTAKRTGWF